MAALLRLLRRARALPPPLAAASKPISTSPTLLQEAQAEAPSPPVPLPSNPSSGSPLYQQRWRSPAPPSPPESLSLVPSPFSPLPPSHVLAFSLSHDASSLQNLLADFVTSQRWDDLRQVFEFWVRSLGPDGKPNRPDVALFNHYLRANFMLGCKSDALIDLVEQMELEYAISPNTASYNLVIKAMCRDKQAAAAEALIQRMLQLGSIALPDEESYNLIIMLLVSEDQIDSALKYLDLMLKSGHMVTMDAFMDCARRCANSGRLDTLASIIDRCKKMDQNKALCPGWNLSNSILSVALQADHSKLAYFGLEFLARWISHGERARPSVLLSADEGLIVSALGVAGRTFDATLLEASWSILGRSLRKRKLPNPESYLGKIHAYASLGNLQRAFSTLNEYETAYGDSPEAEELFSPFTSLHPLVLACCKDGFATLDSVYFQLEHLSRGEPPYKSVAALNCVLLGSANIWDLERAYETFESISKAFDLTPNIHSYNALMSAFGKNRKTVEAAKVFEHTTSIGMNPNSTTYSLLVDAHLVNRDQRAALNVISEMIDAGFVPSKDTLKRLRRRCIRESDFDSDDQVQLFVKKFNYRMFGDVRREQLFNLDFSTEYS